MQKELEDDRPLPGEVILEMRDVGEPLIPDFLADVRRGQPLASEDLGVHAHDQDLLVVRTVSLSLPSTSAERSNFPAIRSAAGDAPIFGSFSGASESQ